MTADEHYLSTLLAYHSQDLHTDCLGLLANSSWASAARKPLQPELHAASVPSAVPHELTAGLLLDMRRPHMHCQGNLAIYSAARTFGTFLDAYAPGPVEYDARVLHFECPLFGEGFGADLAPELLQLMTSPAGRTALQILPAAHARPALTSEMAGLGADPAAVRTARAQALKE